MSVKWRQMESVGTESGDVKGKAWVQGCVQGHVLTFQIRNYPVTTLSLIFYNPESKLLGGNSC